MRLARVRKLVALLPVYEGLSPTYSETGATTGSIPGNYRITERRVRVGSGMSAFDDVSSALLGWDMHRRSGLTVAADGPAKAGSTVVLGLGVGLALVIPCRVIYVIDEPRRRGFAYGALPGHPEQGEEAFVITHDTDGTVWFDITAFSRPGCTPVQLMGPLGHLAQSFATTRYQRALRASATTKR